MRWHLRFVALAGVVATAVACGGSTTTSGGTGGAITSLTVGYYANPNPERVAQQKGWFDQELGVKVSWKPFESGAAMMAAITSGAIQFTCESGTPPIAAAAAQGGNQEIFWINENAAEALAVKPSSNISTISNLTGKKIGTIVGSTDYFSLVVALQKNGVDVTKVNIIDGPVPDLVAAYKRGDLDGVYIPYPGLGEVVSAGGRILITSDQVSAQYGYPTFDACVVSRTWASQHKDVLTKWVKVEDKAAKYYKSNPDDALAAIAANTGLTVAQAKEQSAVYTFPTAKEQTETKWLGTSSNKASAGVTNSIKLTAQLQVKLGRIQSEPAHAEDVDDPTFVEAVG